MKVSVAAVALLAFAIVGVSTAGAATTYKPSECQWTGSVLYCERTFQTTESVSGQTYVQDSTCPSGQRVFNFTETDLLTWRQFDYFSGRAPLAKWNIAGDEIVIATEVLAYEATDAGCA